MVKLEQEGTENISLRFLSCLLFKFSLFIF
jgi:hypothetical protein